VAAAARALRRVRAEALPKLKGGLRALYRTLELPGANPLRTLTPRWTPPSSLPTASAPKEICSPNSSPEPGSRGKIERANRHRSRRPAGLSRTEAVGDGGCIRPPAIP